MALGRKTHLFASSDGGGHRWAVLCSLIETCKLNGVEPYAHLKDVLERMVDGYPIDRLDELLPWAWKAGQAELRDSLHGCLREHHRFLIAQHLKTIEQLEATIAAFDARIEAALAPFRDPIERLTDLPGFSETSIAVLLAEVGADMMQFPTAGHLLSWAALVPRLDESAGKRRSARVRKGAPWLKTVPIQCAWAAARTKDRYFHAQFLRLRARSGPKKAAVAVAGSILTVPYHMLKRTEPITRISEQTTSSDVTPPELSQTSRTAFAALATKSISGPPHDKIANEFLDRHSGVVS